MIGIFIACNYYVITKIRKEVKSEKLEVKSEKFDDGSCFDRLSTTMDHQPSTLPAGRQASTINFFH